MTADRDAPWVCVSASPELEMNVNYAGFNGYDCLSVLFCRIFKCDNKNIYL